MQNSWPAWVLFLAPALVSAQTSPEIRQILDRLERLEKENHELAQEVRMLREQLGGRPAAREEAAPEAAPAQASQEDRLTVQEHRTEELAQSKVEASQKLPVKLTGMLLFNTFWNTRYNSAGTQYPTT